MKVTKHETQEAINHLREMIKPGDTVFTVLLSRSGMSWNIDCYILRDNKLRCLSMLVAKATGFSFNQKRECLRVGGCGMDMDMGFHVVTTLSRVLYPDGFEEHCPSNDHISGDSAVKHRWM